MKILDYFSSWEGWICDIDDNKGTCGEVIEDSREELQAHLKNKHGIIFFKEETLKGGIK